MRMKKAVLSFLFKYWKERKLQKARKVALGWEAPNMKHLKLEKLTEQEIKEIERVWGRLGMKPYLLFYEMFKTIDSFNPQYLSDDLYYPLIVRTLNPDSYSKAFAHKGHFTLLFDGIQQPTLICLCNLGTLYDKDFNVTDQDKALTLLSKSTRFIIKPIMDSSCGKGVKLIKGGSLSEMRAVINEYGDNWIAQEVVEQPEITDQFNPTSLNSFRITTLFINGRVTTQSIMFKVGASGSVVDNLGAGGLSVGVNKDGVFREFGYNNKYERFEGTPTGIQFKGVKIDVIPELCRKMEHYHQRYFPSLGIVGWDTALDKDMQPVVIEVNLNFPGIQFEQLAISTPIFGDRTEEVVEYVLKHQHDQI